MTHHQHINLPDLDEYAHIALRKSSHALWHQEIALVCTVPYANPYNDVKACRAR